MTQVKAVIADDEEQLRLAIKRRLAEVWPELTICGEAGNGKEALHLVETHRPQVAFLDIHMPGLSGMEVAGKIAGMCHVVFVTAYDRYAVEAFENEAVDYLLKPVTRERLDQTAKRLKKKLTAAAMPSKAMTAMAERLMARFRKADKPQYLQWIKVQSGSTVRLIPVTDVIYFKASDKYTLVMTAEKESLIRKTIKELSTELDPASFWQIHRGTIVNVQSIDAVSRSLTGRGVIKLKERPEPLTVSRSYLHLFRQM